MHVAYIRTSLYVVIIDDGHIVNEAKQNREREEKKDETD
jgi:hypothetical protein